MPDENEAEAGSTFGDSLERIAEGGLLRLIVSKPIQQSIGRLIYAASDVPTAKLEQWAQGIRSDTAATKLITGGIATKVKALAIDDQDLVDRGIERWTRKLATGQRRRESVAIRTLSVLAEDDLPPETAPPSEEFMGMFEDIAEKASSDDLADLMARILAGEIRQPRSVSRRTLQVVSILDREIVETIHSVAPYLLWPDWVHIPPSQRTLWRERFELLSSVSISSEISPRMLEFDEHDQCGMLSGKSSIVVSGKTSKGSRFIDGANLTPIGRELMSVLPFMGEEAVEDIALGFKEYPFISRVEIGEATGRREDQYGINMRPV